MAASQTPNPKSLSRADERNRALEADNIEMRKFLKDYGLTWVSRLLSDTMYLSISFGKSTPPQNRQLNIPNNSKQ